jgi:hypothetical protein
MVVARVLKVVLTLVPKVVTAVTITAAISAAIRPYSRAVTARLSVFSSSQVLIYSYMGLLSNSAVARVEHCVVEELLADSRRKSGEGILDIGAQSGHGSDDYGSNQSGNQAIF